MASGLTFWEAWRLLQAGWYVRRAIWVDAETGEVTHWWKIWEGGLVWHVEPNEAHVVLATEYGRADFLARDYTTEGINPGGGNGDGGDGNGDGSGDGDGSGNGDGSGSGDGDGDGDGDGGKGGGRGDANGDGIGDASAPIGGGPPPWPGPNGGAPPGAGGAGGGDAFPPPSADGAGGISPTSESSSRRCPRGYTFHETGRSGGRVTGYCRRNPKPERTCDFGAATFTLDAFPDCARRTIHVELKIENLHRVGTRGENPPPSEQEYTVMFFCLGRSYEGGTVSGADLNGNVRNPVLVSRDLRDIRAPRGANFTVTARLRGVSGQASSERPCPNAEMPEADRPSAEVMGWCLCHPQCEELTEEERTAGALLLQWIDPIDATSHESQIPLLPSGAPCGFSGVKRLFEGDEPEPGDRRLVARLEWTGGEMCDRWALSVALETYTEDPDSNGTIFEWLFDLGADARRLGRQAHGEYVLVSEYPAGHFSGLIVTLL